MERSGRYRVEARGARLQRRSSQANAAARGRLRPPVRRARELGLIGGSGPVQCNSAGAHVAPSPRPLGSGSRTGSPGTPSVAMPPGPRSASARPGDRDAGAGGRRGRAAARHAGARRTARVRHGEQVLRSRIRRTLVGEARDRHTFPWNPGFRLPSADGIAARVGEGHPRVQRPSFPAPECSADAAAALGAKRSGEREARPSGRVCRPTTPGKPPRSVRCVPASYSALGPLNSAPAA
jgi:hypothetical protein